MVTKNREFKLVTFREDGKRQTAKITPDSLFFSCNPQINHTKIEKYLLLFTANTNILTLMYRQLMTVGKSFNFAVAVWRNVMLNLSNGKDAFKQK